MARVVVDAVWSNLGAIGGRSSQDSGGRSQGGGAGLGGVGNPVWQ